MTEGNDISLELDEQSTSVRRVTLVGLVVNLALSAAKFFGGILGNSQAVTMDGVHSLSDCVTDIAILVGVRFWTKPPDECHPYGHRQIETLVTVFIGFALAATALALGWRAVDSLLNPNESVLRPSYIALAAACASIAAKEAMYQWTKRAGKKVGSSALMANAWHHRTDALSSLPVAAAVIAVKVNPDLYLLDSLGALVVTGFILYAAWKIVASSLGKLTERGLSPEDVSRLRQCAQSVPGVHDAHSIRTRFGGLGLQVDLHITVDAKITVKEGHDIATQVQRAIGKSVLKARDVVVHTEPHEES